MSAAPRRGARASPDRARRSPARPARAPPRRPRPRTPARRAPARGLLSSFPPRRASLQFMRSRRARRVAPERLPRRHRALLRVDVDAEAHARVLARSRDLAQPPRRPHGRQAALGAPSRPAPGARVRAGETARRDRARLRAAPGAPRRLRSRRSRTRRRPRAPRRCSTARAYDPDQVRERRVAERLAALRARPRGSRRCRGVRRVSIARASGRSSAPARGPRRRARRGRPAGRSARTCAPRRGSRGSAGSRRHRARRRAQRRGSRGPWRPSACRSAPRSGRLEAAQQRPHALSCSPGLGVGAAGRGSRPRPEQRRRRRRGGRSGSSPSSSTAASSCCRRSVPAPWRATAVEEQSRSARAPARGGRSGGRRR